MKSVGNIIPHKLCKNEPRLVHDVPRELVDCAARDSCQETTFKHRSVVRAPFNAGALGPVRVRGDELRH